MEIRWHEIDFTCPIGHSANILQVNARADGVIQFNGLCVACGKEVSFEFTIEQMLSACTLQDSRKSSPLEDFIPKGKPS